MPGYRTIDDGQPAIKTPRRRFLRQFGGATVLSALTLRSIVTVADDTMTTTDDRLWGVVVGGLLGDALGGPMEFAEGPQLDRFLPRVRQWPADRTITPDDLEQLGKTLPLLSYETLRPGTEPYGPWRPQGPPGSVTDDTRHKIVLMRTLRRAVRDDRFPVTARDLATQFVEFTPINGVAPAGNLKQLNDEGFHEYRLAARWLLGQRDEALALPVSRLWAGIDNCSGQMLLPPLAAAFAGDPLAAYRGAYAIDFIDSYGARDIAAALVAALAAVLDPVHDRRSSRDRWQILLTALRDTDPLRLAHVPFAGRPLHRWLNLAESLAQQAGGRPAKVFELLETRGAPVYWWDAHFTLLVPLTLLHFCQFQPLAALHLTLDFGHDTDSYAQVLGAMAGAVEGAKVFPTSMQVAVRRALQEDFAEDLDDWIEILTVCRRRHQASKSVVADFTDSP